MKRRQGSKAIVRSLLLIISLLILGGFNQTLMASSVGHKQDTTSDSFRKFSIDTHGKAIVFFLDNLGLTDLGDRDLPHLYRTAQQGGLGLFHRRSRNGLFSGGGDFMDESYRDALKEAEDRSLHGAYITVPNSDAPIGLIIEKIIRQNDITFLDFRRHYSSENNVLPTVEERRQLIEADHLLADLIRHSGLEHRSFIILSAKPSVNQRTEGNKTLNTLIILTENPRPGILASNTTRRKGLVSSLDIVPTIFSLIADVPNNKRNPDNIIRIAPDKNNIITIRKNLEQYLNLKNLRYLSHGIYIAFLIGALLLLFLPQWRRGFPSYPRAARYLGICTIAFPACIFLISVFIPAGRWPPAIIIMGLVSASVAFPLSLTVKRTLAGLGWISLLTSLYLIGGQLLRSNLLLWNPLGFTDVFAGGRFYGMNNDCMGIMLGSTTLAMFYGFERWIRIRWIQIILSVLLFLLAILSQTPFFGANVGGTIAAMATGALAVIGTLSERLIRKKRVILIVGLVLLAEFFIAYLDYRFGIVRTHAGNAMGELLHHSAGNPVLGILQSKLILFSVMLLIPPWNILFALELTISLGFRKQFSGEYPCFAMHYPYLTRVFPVLFYGGLVAFLFNDTGIISAGIMLIYLLIPLGVLSLGQESIVGIFGREKKLPQSPRGEEIH